MWKKFDSHTCKKVFRQTLWLTNKQSTHIQPTQTCEKSYFNLYLSLSIPHSRWNPSSFSNKVWEEREGRPFLICWAQSKEASGINTSVFGMAWSGIKPTTSRLCMGECSNHWATALYYATTGVIQCKLNKPKYISIFKYLRSIYNKNC